MQAVHFWYSILMGIAMCLTEALDRDWVIRLATARILPSIIPKSTTSTCRSTRWPKWVLLTVKRCPALRCTTAAKMRPSWSRRERVYHRTSKVPQSSRGLTQPKRIRISLDWPSVWHPRMQFKLSQLQLSLSNGTPASATLKDPFQAPIAPFWAIKTTTGFRK